MLTAKVLAGLPIDPGGMFGKLMEGGEIDVTQGSLQINFIDAPVIV